MTRNLSGRYAAVTSTLALVVALGGTGYAAGLIGTSQIKNNAVTSPKIKNDTVTGKDVKEGSLGVVPQAHAVGGVQAFTIDFRQTGSVSNVKILRAGPLTLLATCSGGSSIAIAATSTTAASIYTQVQYDGDPANPLENDTEGLGLSAGDPFDMLDGSNGNIDLVSFWYDNAHGVTITGTFSVDSNGSPGCVVEGHALLS